MASFKFNLTLLSDIRTREDALAFIDKLEQVKTNLFKKKQADDILKENVTPHQRQAILHYCEENQVNISEPQALADLLTGLQETVDDAHHVTLRLAFRPSAAFIEELADWFAQNVGQKVLLDIKVDKDIIGGVEILSNGLRSDHTLRKEVDNMLSAHAG